MDKIKDHYQELSKKYDNSIIKFVPKYNEMLDAIINSLPNTENKLSILDIGCGTGNLTQKLLNKYIDSQITAIDISEAMIEAAKSKVNHSNIEFIVQDALEYEFKENYDIIVSTLTFQNFPNDAFKKKYYQNIYNSLNINGIFATGNIMLASNKELQEVYLKKWKEFMLLNLKKETIDDEVFKNYKEKDHPSKTLDEIDWLIQIGFKDVDIIWKYYNFAVYFGMKK